MTDYGGPVGESRVTGALVYSVHIEQTGPLNGSEELLTPDLLCHKDTYKSNMYILSGHWMP